MSPILPKNPKNPSGPITVRVDVADFEKLHGENQINQGLALHRLLVKAGMRLAGNELSIMGPQAEGELTWELTTREGRKVWVITQTPNQPSHNDDEDY